MLETLMFYFFIWWFTKLEDKKILIVRAVLATILAIFNIVCLIVMLTEEVLIKDGLNLLGFIFLPFFIGFFLRVIFDIKKIRLLND